MRIILMFLLLPMCSYAQEERIIEITSNSQGDNNVFLIVDTPPRFKGGEQKQVKFYEKISKFDIPKRHERGFPVYFQIVVNEDGSISNVEIINDPSQFLVNEVTRIIKLMPLWVPGRINGKAVKVRVTQKINFLVNDQQLSSVVHFNRNVALAHSLKLELISPGFSQNLRAL